MGSIQSIGDINQVKTSLELKAEADDVLRLRKEFDHSCNIFNILKKASRFFDDIFYAKHKMR